MLNRIWCPKIQAFNHSSLAALGVFPFLYVQVIFTSSKYLNTSRDQSESANTDETFDTIQLAGAFFTIGGYIGNYIIIHFISFMPPRRLFLIADISLILAQASSLLTLLRADRIYMLTIFYLFRIVAGVGNGMNLVLSIVFIQQMTTKRSFPILAIWMPLFIQFGLLVAIVTQYYDDGTLNYFIIQQLIPVLPLFIRVVMFQTCFTDESPHYLYFIEKDETKALRVLNKIHIALSSKRNFQSEELFRSNDTKNNKGSFVETYSAMPQLQLQKYPNMQSLYNNLMPDNLYNEFYFVKFVKCIIIIMFTQFSGFFVITTYAEFMDQKSNVVGGNWLLAGVITSLATIILNFFLSQIIKKLWLIVAGQGFMAVGLILFAIQLPNSFLIGSCLFFFGYSLGIGTFAFVLIPQLVPDIGILQTNLFQWFFIILCQCLVAIYNNRQLVHAADKSLVFAATMFYFFGASFLGIGVLFYILKDYKRKQTKKKMVHKEEQQKLQQSDGNF